MNLQSLGKIPKRRIDQFAIALTVLVGATLAVAFLGRGVSAFKLVKAQEESLVHRLEYLTEVAAMLGEGEATLTFLQERTQQLNQRLPMRVDYQSFYADLAGIAEQEGVDLLEVQQQDIHTEPDYLELPIEVHAEATYENLYTFLYGLSTMPRLVKIHSLKVGMADEHPICKIDLDLRIYSVNVAALNE